jgi:hypothetical protein
MGLPSSGIAPEVPSLVALGVPAAIGVSGAVLPGSTGIVTGEFPEPMGSPPSGATPWLDELSSFEHAVSAVSATTRVSTATEGLLMIDAPFR